MRAPRSLVTFALLFHIVANYAHAAPTWESSAEVTAEAVGDSSYNLHCCPAGRAGCVSRKTISGEGWCTAKDVLDREGIPSTDCSAWKGLPKDMFPGAIDCSFDSRAIPLGEMECTTSDIEIRRKFGSRCNLEMNSCGTGNSPAYSNALRACFGVEGATCAELQLKAKSEVTHGSAHCPPAKRRCDGQIRDEFERISCEPFENCTTSTGECRKPQLVAAECGLCSFRRRGKTEAVLPGLAQYPVMEPPLAGAKMCRVFCGFGLRDGLFSSNGFFAFNGRQRVECPQCSAQ